MTGTYESRNRGLSDDMKEVFVKNLMKVFVKNIKDVL